VNKTTFSSERNNCGANTRTG